MIINIISILTLLQVMIGYIIAKELEFVDKKLPVTITISLNMM